MTNLISGQSMPNIGLGTYELTSDTGTVDILQSAFCIGYRLIDTAKSYGNETSIGRALASSPVSREDVFITTKVWNDDQGYEPTLTAFEKSLERLGLEYVDLYLIHWPDDAKMLDTWRAMEALYTSGKAKSIGVANFSLTDLSRLLPYASVLPAVNQIQLQPFLYAKQKRLIDFCQQQGIVIEGYSPLSHGVMVSHPAIIAIAKRYGKTGAQIMLRWAIQHGVVPIPKSSKIERLNENIDVFNFEISAEDMRWLDSLGAGL